MQTTANAGISDNSLALFRRLIERCVAEQLQAETVGTRAILLPAPSGPLKARVLVFHEGMEFCSEDGRETVTVFYDRGNKGLQWSKPGTWYGSVARIDNDGHTWMRSLDRMVQDDFGQLVEVAQ